LGNINTELDTAILPAEPDNNLTFDEKVIKKIVGYSAGEIPGILAMSGNFIAGITDMLRNADDPTKGVTVEVGKKQVSVSMKIICEYGLNIPDIFQELVNKVTGAIKQMTGLDVVSVKVHVYDVITKEEFERQTKKKAEEKKAEEKTDAISARIGENANEEG
jgi:uncharacterized alkaline shock family protein YloU